jgi:hypothetical protein
MIWIFKSISLSPLFLSKWGQILTVRIYFKQPIPKISSREMRTIKPPPPFIVASINKGLRLNPKPLSFADTISSLLLHTSLSRARLALLPRILLPFPWPPLIQICSRNPPPMNAKSSSWSRIAFSLTTRCFNDALQKGKIFPHPMQRRSWCYLHSSSVDLRFPLVNSSAASIIISKSNSSTWTLTPFFRLPFLCTYAKHFLACLPTSLYSKATSSWNISPVLTTKKSLVESAFKLALEAAS